MPSSTHIPPLFRDAVPFFLACVLFHTIGTWSLPMIDRDEPRFAEAAREMIERGDYIVPFFNNDYRFDKPPLTYWAQTVSYQIFGESDFAARFPSAIAAALTALVLLTWGAQIRDRRTGWWAAIIFTLSLQTFVHAKASVADMWLVLFVTIAHWTGWRAFVRDQTSNFKYQAFFYISLALAFLAKGPIGWTPLLTVLICSRRQRPMTVATAARILAGLALMLTIVCAWGVPALMRTHGEFWRIGIGRHVIERSVAPMEGHGASSVSLYLVLLPFYFVAVFASLFPWSIKLPALTKHLFKQRDATDQFLLVGALVIFVIFTLVRTKLPHYTLPAFPLLALLLARRYDEIRLSPRLAAVTPVILFLIALSVPPAIARFFPSLSLAHQSHENLRPEMEFGAIDYIEPSLVWYFRKNIRGFMTPLKRKDAGEFMNQPGARFLVLPTKLTTDGSLALDPARKIYRANGFNIVKGRRVELTLLLKSQ